MSDAIYVQDGDRLDKIPTTATAYAASEMVQIGNLAGVCINANAAAQSTIDAAASDPTLAVQVEGVFDIAATAATGNVGDNVWWDINGTPVGGSTTGAVTTIGSAGDFWVGTLVKAKTAGQATARVALNVANPYIPFFAGRLYETISANVTLDVQDNGKVLLVDTDAFVITLPAIATGGDVVIMNNAATDGAAIITISPNSNDKIQGPNIAGTDNKDFINTKATAKRGDYVHLTAGPNADGWSIVEMRGTWATEG